MLPPVWKVEGYSPPRSAAYDSEISSMPNHLKRWWLGGPWTGFVMKWGWKLCNSTTSHCNKHLLGKGFPNTYWDLHIIGCTHWGKLGRRAMGKACNEGKLAVEEACNEGMACRRKATSELKQFLEQFVVKLWDGVNLPALLYEVEWTYQHCCTKVWKTSSLIGRYRMVSCVWMIFATKGELRYSAPQKTVV